MENKLLSAPKNNFKKFLKIFLGIIILIFVVFLFSQRNVSDGSKYSREYTLVPEKISQSASIKIYLPKGLDKDTAKNNISFDPIIEGNWVEEESKQSFLNFNVFASEGDEEYIVFKPKEKLSLNKYYSLKLDLGDNKMMQAYFESVEDPEITNIFPLDGTEAALDSKITIVFNRPIVPLTTLEESEKINVPVEIYPATEGKFKWISTNTLQFIPKERLQRSSNYTVKVNSDFVSMDGLKIQGKEIHFTSQNLRYLYETDQIKNVVYNEPIRLYFNQPVDLNKTIKEINLFKDDKQIDFVAKYKGDKDKSVTNFFSSLFNSSEKEEEVDKSIIEIYNKIDRFNRSQLWDFEEDYRLLIKKVYPLEGDINIESERSISFNTTSIIESWSATSPRSSYATLDLFDPQGELAINFYEDINISKSNINSSIGIKNIKYGEKCTEDWRSLSDQSCQKIENRKRIIIEFDNNNIKAGDTINLTLKEIINEDGLKINAENINKDIFIYKPLDINIKNKDLRYFIVCSNNPLLQLEKSEYKDKIRGDLDYEVFSFRNSYYDNWSDCKDETPFKTYINVGLMPETKYNFEFDIKDVFGSEQVLKKEFTTGKMDSDYVNAFSMQQGFSITPTSNTKLNFGTQNLNYIDISVCRLSDKNFVDNFNNRYNNSFKKSACSEIQTKRIALPEKYWINNYFNIDIKDFYENTLGNFAVLLSHPQLSTYTPVTFVTVTNMAVGEKRISPYSYSYETKLTESQLKDLKNIYLVSDINTGEAIPNADIYYYSNSGEYKKVGTTNNEGVSLISPIYGLKAVIIKKGDDSTIIQRYESELGYGMSAYNVKKFYIYQDKPIYRPGEKVNIKAILRLGYDGNYEMLDNKEVTLNIRNSKYDEIFKTNLILDNFGTINTNFILPNDAALGNYSICVSDMCSYFDVQEYVPAAFEVKLNTDKEEYISKDDVKVNIDANYYFGVPVENAEVSYTISSQNYYFDKYKEEYFRFGNFDYRSCYYEECYADKFILRGETTLDNNGKGVIKENIDLEKMFSLNNSKIIVIDVTVKNSMGQSVSSQKSFIVHQGEFYLGVNTDPYFTGKNQEFSVKIKSVDNEGKPLLINNGKGEIYKVDWVYAKRQEIGGTFSYKWEKKRELVSEFNFNTDHNGNYLKKVKLDKEGSYDIEVSAKDQKGNIVKSIDDIYIYGEGSVGIRYTDKTDLNLTVKKDSLNVGDKGEIIIESPYKEAKALIAIERGKVFKYEIKDITGNLYKYTFDIEEDYYPNVYVSVLLQSKDEPAVKFGSKEFKINSDIQKINIDFKSDQSFYKPGDEVKLNISTKNYKNEPVSSSVSVAVVDLSVLALKGNPKKDPLIFFYDGFPLAVSTSSNLKNIIERKDIIDQTKGGGGGTENKEKARGEFKDTAFWQASVITDSNGNAEVTFKLPDNLTTWQAEVLGVTEDTKLGVNYTTFMSKKDLMVVPLKPRFIIPGDEFYIGAQIFNQTNSLHSFNISLKSDTLELIDKSEMKINIGAEGSERVYFKVKAPNNISEGFHSFELFAKSGDLSDGVIQAIKINKNLTYEATATANYTTNDFALETLYIPENISDEMGELTIKSSATLAVFLSDALNYLLQYPYGCAEQIASRLKAMAVVKSGLDVPNLADKFNLKQIIYDNKEYTLDEVMQIGLSKLYSYQNYDGGYTFWGNGYSNYYLTLSIVDALNYIKEAGYNVNEGAISKGADYLFKEYNRLRDYQTPQNTIMLTRTLMNVGNFKNSITLKSKIEEIVNNEVLLKDKLSNKFLAELAVIVSSDTYDVAVKNRVNNFLDNKINIDARGAFLDSPKDYSYYYFETTISNTATYLNSLALGKRETSFNDKVLRWLLNSRDKDGTWASTQNNLKVIEAFTNYLKWKKETDANYDLSISLNDSEIESFSFNSSTILNQINKEIKISDLKKGDFNFLEFNKSDKNIFNNGSLYYDLGLKYYLTGGNVAPRDEGFSITRGFYNLDDIQNKTPLKLVNTGDVVKAHIEIIVPNTRRFVAIEDYIPAGLEIINMDLATEQKSLKFTEKEVTNRILYPDFKEIRDDRYFVYKEYLTPGVYEFDYYVRALVKGDYLKLPTIVSEMYNPENFGRTQSEKFKVE